MRAVSAELSICAAPLAEILPLPRFLAKFYLLSAFFSIVPTSATAPFGVKFHLRSQPVFNRAACFVAKFYCRPRSVQSLLVYRKTPARNKARCRYTALLLHILRRDANFKISPALLCAKSFGKILFAALQNSDLYIQSPAYSRKTRAIKFTPLFAFVRPRSKHAAFYRRRDDVF